MVTDPIADMLTRLRNAARAKHLRVDIPASRLKVEIARILKEEGFISSFKVVDEGRHKKILRVQLKYAADKRCVISDLRRVSRPGSRRYVSCSQIRPVVGGLGLSILTTPRGLMSGRAARKAGLGGEVLCEVW
jgi:small subunit ribosomal protein S8